MDNQEIRNAIFARQVASDYYLTNPLVTLIDVGWKYTGGENTGELAVRVHLRRKPGGAAFETFRAENPGLEIDKSLIPFKVDIIEGKYPLHQSWWNPQPDDARTASCNPLQGGISVAGEYVVGSGTLGGIVEDRVTRQKMILSNWHVLVGSDYGVPGTQIFQPGWGDYYGSHGDTVALLDRHAFAQGIDAAVATLTGGRSWVNDALGIGPVTGCTAPVIDMRVVKSGRTSQVTHGVIDGFEGIYPIYYNGVLHSIQYVYRIVPQTENSEVSRPGDSGSWWLEEDTRKAVALHFAGESDPDAMKKAALAIDMPQVLNSLNVDIALGQPAVPGPAHELITAGG